MFDIIIVNLDVVSYLCMRPKKYLLKVENEKKDLYLQSLLYHRHSFTPMVYYVYGIPVAEALAAQSRLSELLSFNINREYS